MIMDDRYASTYSRAAELKRWRAECEDALHITEGLDGIKVTTFTNPDPSLRPTAPKQYCR
jgi:hypothetical protein